MPTSYQPPARRQSPRPSASGARASRKSRSLRALFSNPLFAVTFVALIVICFVLIRNASTAGGDYYLQGIYVNNVDMSKFTKDQGEQKLNDWASRILNAEYTLVYGEKTWLLRPKDIGASINTDEVLQKAWNLGHTGSRKDRENTLMVLKYSPQYLWTELKFDESRLQSFISGIASEVYIAPKDADIVLDITRPIVLSPSVDGRELDTDALYETLISAISGGVSAQIALPVADKPAAISSSLSSNGLELIVSYTTSLEGSSSARKSNIRTALQNFNGFEVKVGETISFNEVVGARTALRGYQEATVYYGASVTTGMGGGICQASSTLYAAVLRADMTIVERHNHTLVVSYCPASMDAAVSEDSSDDFVFVNNTDYNIYIYTEVSNTDATVKIYGSRPDYRIELVPTILQNNIKNPSITKVPDESGLYAYYTDDLRLKKEGKLGRRSMLERVYYDWTTGAEVKRETISNDYYQGERDIYWVGVHPVANGQQ